MILSELLVILNTVKKLKSTDIEVQKLLTSGNYSGAITILLDCKNSATKNSQLKCVELLTQKLQDTLINTEVQLDNVLNQVGNLLYLFIVCCLQHNNNNILSF